MKTNAMRILDSMGIEYESLYYEISPEMNTDIALHSAKILGIPEEQTYKTLVMVSEAKNYFVFCVPALFEVSLKKAKQAAGCSQIDLIKQDQLLGLTGYIRGGCSPLGMKRHFTTFIEELALLEDTICVSGGQRGLSLRLRPQDLARAAQAQFTSLVN